MQPNAQAIVPRSALGLYHQPDSDDRPLRCCRFGLHRCREASTRMRYPHHPVAPAEAVAQRPERSDQRAQRRQARLGGDAGEAIADARPQCAIRLLGARLRSREAQGTGGCQRILEDRRSPPPAPTLLTPTFAARPCTRSQSAARPGRGRKRRREARRGEGSEKAGRNTSPHATTICCSPMRWTTRRASTRRRRQREDSTLYAPMLADPSKYGEHDARPRWSGRDPNGHPADATSSSRPALAQNPYSRDAINNLAATYIQNNEFTKAFPLIDKLIAMDPSNPDNPLLYAFAYQGLYKGRRTRSSRRSTPTRSSTSTTSRRTRQ